jgi:hypothetical protein
LEAKAANNAEQEAWKWFSRNKGGQKLDMETVGRERSQGFSASRKRSAKS